MAQQIPEITESTKFNLITSIWIVPIIALIIAGWLAYQHFAERGPEIKITFPQNEGLVAGQSVVKFRNVPVGKVTSIYPEKNSGVVVVVRMNSKTSKPYLSEHARFWIVKPEVGLSGVSGLDTLLSGTYINVYSHAGGKNLTNKFIGLPHAYRDNLKGEYFHLTSPNGDSVSVGTPIYYKNIKVGQVEYFYLGLDGKKIEIIIFIENQYVPYVHYNSKFWTKSLVNVDYSKGNLDLSVASLNYLVQGGIVFSSSGEKKEDAVPDKYIFPLYKSRAEADSKRIGVDSSSMRKFILHTKGPIARLKVNSVVRYDEYDIGEVDEIELSYDKVTHQVLGKVLIELDTSFFQDINDEYNTGEENLYQAVKEGLRAKMASLDPLSRMLYVDLTFDHQDGNGSIVQGEKYAELPMATVDSGGIMDSVNQILTKLNNLPLEKLLASVTKVVEETALPVQNANELLVDLQTTVKNINKLPSKKSFEVMPDELNKALREMTKTLKNTSKVVKGYDSNSLVKQQLAQTLEILTKTSQEMQVFLRMLNRKPNSLIFGDN
jgi:paraquat-inducible protein B